MKKSLITIIGCYFFFLFLVYSGIFRNYSDPVGVTRYYYECVKNREWFLTYQIYVPDYFYAVKITDEYSTSDPFLIGKIKLDLLRKEEGHALVLAELLYKTKKQRQDLVELEFKDGKWLIRGIKYNYINISKK